MNKKIGVGLAVIAIGLLGAIAYSQSVKANNREMRKRAIQERREAILEEGQSSIAGTVIGADGVERLVVGGPAWYEGLVNAGVPDWIDPDSDEGIAFAVLLDNESGLATQARNTVHFGVGQLRDEYYQEFTPGKDKNLGSVQVEAAAKYILSRPDYDKSAVKALEMWNARSPHWY